MMKTIQKGFTLIELLVVITIIGILATGAVTTFTSQIQKARDTTRISDLNALQSGIEQFYQDTSEYPSGWEDWLTQVGATSVQDYNPRLAQDPKDTQNCNTSKCWYAYIVAADSNGITDGAYELSTAFENDANKNQKAANTADNGNDLNRLELGVGNGALDTDKANSGNFGTTDLGASDTTAKIHVKNSAITAF